MGTSEKKIKKSKEKDWTEFRYYAVPEDTHMLALQGDEWLQCFGEGVTSLHFHNHMEIGYCYYGEGEMLIGDQSIPFRRGTCTMIPKNIPHTTNSKPGTLSRWEYIFADVEGLADRMFAGKRMMRDRAVRLLNGTAYVLAEVCYLSESHFRKLFREKMNMTPTDYISLVRVQVACEMLSKTEKSILDIGQAVGFPSLSTFNRNFRKIMGISPVQWKHVPQNYDQKIVNWEIMKGSLTIG